MRKIEQFFAEYAESHQNKTNKIIHWICVPLIFFSIAGFISLIPSPLTNILNKIVHFMDAFIGHIHINSILNLPLLITIILVSIFYFRLSKIVGFIMLLVMLFVASTTNNINIKFKNSWIIYFTIFVITWIFQFIGHKIEGKKPSFLKDLQFLLVGPIWLLHFILKKIGIKY